MLQVRKKISHKLFSALFLVAVIPISIMGIGMYRAAQETLIDSALMHIQTVAQNHAARLDTWYGERLNDIMVLSRISGVRELSLRAAGPDSSTAAPIRKEFIDDALALTRGKSQSYQSIHALTPGGEVLASTDDHCEMIVSNKYLEDLDRLKNAAGPVLSPLHLHSNREWYIHLTAPVYLEDGSVGAVIFAVLDASYTLGPLLTDRAGLGETGEAYLVSGEGKIVTPSLYLDHESTKNRRFETTGIVSALDGKQGVSIYRNYMGREVVGSYMWIPRYHSALLVEMETDEILGPLRGIRMAVFGTAGAVSLICILAALLLSRQISRPITEMAEASTRLSTGQLDNFISYSGHDEIGTLSESFNTMAEKLSVLIDSLKQKEASLQKAYDDLVQTQEQLVQSEKMAAIGELVASVVHEMRNPLSSVRLNFQIIGRSLDKDGSLREHYKIGIGQIVQLEGMFSSLLDYSKPLSLEKVPFRVEIVVEEALCQLGPHAAAALEVSGLDGSLPPVFGDPEKMRQVIVNIVKNAIEAAGPGGKIEIGAREIDSGGRKAVVLDVRDNGPGISQQDLKRIFQPFFTTKQKGTGLGLSIVRKIVEAHRFGISVSSREGDGTLFSLQMHGA